MWMQELLVDVMTGLHWKSVVTLTVLLISFEPSDAYAGEQATLQIVDSPSLVCICLFVQ